MASGVQSHLSSMCTYVVINLTAFGTILGVSIGVQREDSFQGFFRTPQMLLILPIFSFLIGSLIYFHSKRISQVGLYVRNNLEPRLRTAVGVNGEEKVLSWESYVRETEARRRGVIRWLSLSGLSILTCVGTCLVSLVAFALAIPSPWQPLETLLFFVGLGLLSWLILLVVLERRSWWAAVTPPQR